MASQPRTRMTRQEQQRLTRERLLQAADEVFTERGFARATLEEISERAGYTRTAVYKHFDHKAELFLVVAEARATESLAALRGTIERERGDAVRLASLGQDIAADITGMRRWFAAMLEFLPLVVEEPELRARVRRAQRAADEHIAAMLTALCRSLGIEPPAPIDQLVLSVYALVNGLAIRALFDDEIDLPRTISDGLIALVQASISALPDELVENEVAR